ncbi:peptidylprolyl isomerase [Candidatus Pelagibacter communis]|uniref:peptidylprolyl isomerase n=1 Tax=Pelagibacter ubique TaxID=198252 RepID=UPI00094BF13F|nr:peptidylprolyl isomerase [Candidatus Pelagibacter ubique]
MIKKKILFLIITIFFSNKILLADIKIEVLVDNEIITNYDLENEINYLEILNSNLNQLNYNQKLEIAKNSLIKQIIKKKEIKKFTTMEGANQFVDDYMKDLYTRLGFNNDKEFEKILKQKTNYNLSKIKEKIEIDLYWNDLIFSKYNNQVKIDKKKILSRVNAMQEDSKKEYFLSEIVFTKKKNRTIQDYLNEIKISINQIGFNNTANIYSDSDSSKFGGKIGWVSEISLSKNIKDKLSEINKGEFTDLIKLANNFLILKIEDKRVVEINIDKNKEVERLINQETNEQLNKFSKIYFNKSKLNYSINEK